MESIRLQFVYSAIADTQQVIRGLDVKIGFLFVVTMVPASHIDSVWSVYQYYADNESPLVVVCAVCAFLWVISVYVMFMALNVKVGSHVVALNDTQKGRYFNSDLFKIRFFDAFYNKSNISPEKSLKTVCSEIPCSEETAFQELSSDMVRLSCIRSYKAKRVYWCINLTFWWIGLGVLLWVCSLHGD